MEVIKKYSQQKKLSSYQNIVLDKSERKVERNCTRTLRISTLEVT